MLKKNILKSYSTKSKNSFVIYRFLNHRLLKYYNEDLKRHDLEQSLFKPDHLIHGIKTMLH